MRAFRILEPGVFTTVQDEGRFGLMKYGIPPSGAMDQYSYQIGNLLLSNPQGAPSLEITLQGLMIEALSSVAVAITGADLSPHISNAPVPQWRPFVVKEGQVLHFRRRKTGFRAYLAVKGGFDVPEVLGSRSTFLRGRMGTTLFKGTILRIGDQRAGLPMKYIEFPKEYMPNFSVREPIRVLLGPQEDYYTQQGIETFLSVGYRISSQSDRMAYRLEGAPIEIAKGPGIITEPIARGSIQVPGDGQPIILLRDAQVTGGYAKIGAVTTVDMNRLAQMMPGDKIYFQKVDHSEAISLLKEENSKKKDLKTLFAK